MQKVSAGIIVVLAKRKPKIVLPHENVFSIAIIFDHSNKLYMINSFVKKIAILNIQRN